MPEYRVVLKDGRAMTVKAKSAQAAAEYVAGELRSAAVKDVEMTSPFDKVAYGPSSPITPGTPGKRTVA